jgi:hypothetical protein
MTHAINYYYNFNELNALFMPEFLNMAMDMTKFDRKDKRQETVRSKQ